MLVVSLQFKRLCRRIDRQYKQNMQKLDTNTDGLCPVGILPRDAKQLQHFATITDGLSCRYFTESCKTITAICHNHRRLYRQNMSRWYFTKSCKTITTPAIITDGWCTFQCVPLSDCLVSWHSYRWNHRQTRQIQCTHALTPFYQQMCRQTSKNLKEFSKFYCEIQKIPMEITDGI